MHFRSRFRNRSLHTHEWRVVLQPELPLLQHVVGVPDVLHGEDHRTHVLSVDGLGGVVPVSRVRDLREVKQTRSQREFKTGEKLFSQEEVRQTFTIFVLDQMRFSSITSLSVIRTHRRLSILRCGRLSKGELYGRLRPFDWHPRDLDHATQFNLDCPLGTSAVSRRRPAFDRTSIELKMDALHLQQP